MSSVQETSETGDRSNPAIELFATIRNSVTLTIALLGVILFVAGFIINTGVWAAIYAVWGTALFLFGVTAYAIIWWQRH
ncbi:hypothetical protein [Haladaptatus pallidirubidus]|uniref:hypothetical protein n=1 Tax=Haladaptatus pallidirubidus TaxID=1008152 RepID=UPI001D1047F9|nr:hypothetical protein [Haladaptatus pallidirubidus]